MDIILVGATGAMGKTILNLVEDKDKYNVVAGIADQGKVDQDIKIYPSFDQVEEKADLIIDFSAPALLKDELEFAKAKKLPLVIASTGHDEENEKLIHQASKEIPILYTGNTSIGINVMEYLVEKMARLLEDFDIEIVERHHNKKKDSPSGTAKMLYRAANRGRGENLHEVEGRAGVFETVRDPNEVGISAVRGGTIVGEHSVIFAGNDEVMEIKHTAFSKNIFANGALKAGEFLIDQENGLYNMDDVLELVND